MNSDVHEGLTAAIAQVFKASCRVHFMRNALAYVPKARRQMLAAAIRSVFGLGKEASDFRRF